MTPPEQGNNDWNRWSVYVLEALKDLKKGIGELQAKVDGLHDWQTAQQAKASMASVIVAYVIGGAGLLLSILGYIAK